MSTSAGPGVWQPQLEADNGVLIGYPVSCDTAQLILSARARLHSGTVS